MTTGEKREFQDIAFQDIAFEDTAFQDTAARPAHAGAGDDPDFDSRCYGGQWEEPPHADAADGMTEDEFAFLQQRTLDAIYRCVDRLLLEIGREWRDCGRAACARSRRCRRAFCAHQSEELRRQRLEDELDA
jgi:hypothetical protein